MATKTGPRTLAEAREEMTRRTPRGRVSPEEMVQFHEENMRMYQEVAEIDTRHHHEALSFAQIESMRIAALRTGTRGAEAGRE